jgi:hypothetical protein
MVCVYIIKYCNLLALFDVINIFAIFVYVKIEIYFLNLNIEDHDTGI